MHIYKITFLTLIISILLWSDIAFTKGEQKLDAGLKTEILEIPSGGAATKDITYIFDKHITAGMLMGEALLLMKNSDFKVTEITNPVEARNPTQRVFFGILIYKIASLSQYEARVTVRIDNERVTSVVAKRVYKSL